MQFINTNVTALIITCQKGKEGVSAICTGHLIKRNGTDTLVTLDLRGR